MKSSDQDNVDLKRRKTEIKREMSSYHGFYRSKEQKEVGVRKEDETKEFKNNDDLQSEESMVRRYGIGARLLSKMGYKQGKGLGKDGDGITEPIETTKRPQGVGLGMLSQVRDNDEYSEESSSDSDSKPTVSRNRVIFQTKAQLEFTDLIVNLQLLDKYKIELPNEIRDRINGQNIEETKLILLKELVSELVELTQDLERTKTALENLNISSQEKLKEDKIVIEIVEQVMNDSFSLPDQINSVLNINNESMVDDLCAMLLLKEFETGFDVQDFDSLKLKHLIGVIDVLSYRMDSNLLLNKTQSAVFRLFFTKLCQWFESSEEKFRTAKLILLHYSAILEFIHSKDHFISNYILPVLPGSLNNEFLVSGILETIDLIASFCPQESLSEIRSLLKDAFTNFLENWHYSNRINPLDVPILKKILGEEKFYQIVTEHWLPIFAEVYDSYFSPIEELIDPDSKDNSEVFIDVFQRYMSFFSPEKKKQIFWVICNDLLKILFQWFVFKRDSFQTEAESWLNWMVNKLFKNATFEDIKGLSTLYEFLRHPSYESNHNEEISMQSVLVRSDAEDMQQAFDNTPLTRITVSLKDVLELFCAEHGISLRKTNESATIEVFGKERVAPVFMLQTSKGKKSSLAIMDDIIWLRIGKDFKPIYLYNLVGYFQ